MLMKILVPGTGTAAMFSIFHKRRVAVGFVVES